MDRKILISIVLILIVIITLVFPKELIQQNCFGYSAYMLERYNPFTIISEDTAAKIEAPAIYSMCFGIPYTGAFPTAIEGPGGFISEKDKIIEDLSKANYCKVKEDCKIVSYGCPFGCYNFVNKDVDLTSIEQNIENYTANEIRCIYDCDRNPLPEEITCQQNKCVDLRYPNE